MENRKPSRRRDLIIEKGESRGKVFYTVKDPISNQFFRIGETENTLLSLMDGTRELGEIASELKEVAGIDASPEDIGDAVSQFDKLCLLESSLTEKELQRAQKRETTKGKSLLSRLLFIKIKAVNPERFFEALLPKTAFLFTRPALLFSLLVIAAGIAVAVPNFQEITLGIPSLLNLTSLVLVWLTMGTVVAFHEMAHGLTCHHYGGKDRDMGFLLLYFQLCLYCNVSDAWLFKEKYKKIAVTFAGGFFQLFLWAVATIGWRITAEDVMINRIFFIVMVTSGLQFLFNFNPLIKLDGYYLLADLVDIPNLRAKAFRYVKSLLLLEKTGEDFSPREKRIFLLYGLFSIGFSGLLLGYIFFKLHFFLVEKYGAGGFIIFLLIMGLVVSKPTGVLMKKIAGYILTGKGIKGKFLKLLRLLIIALALVLFLALFRWELRVSAGCRFLPVERVTVRNQVDGIVEAVHVREGSVVEPGTSLFSLSKKDLRITLDETLGDLKKNEAELKLLLKGVRPEEIERAEKKRETAMTKLRYARVEHKRLKKLHSSNLLSSRELKEAEEESAVRARELEEAESELKILLAGCQEEEVEKARAEIETLRRKAAYLREEMKLSDVTSPIKGVVTTPHPERRVGEYLEKGEELLRVADIDVMEVEIYVSEKEIGEVTANQKIKMKVWGYPGRSFFGKVASIAETARDMEENSPAFVVVRSTVENPDHLLKPEMTGNAKIYCGKRSLLTLITRRLVRFVRVEFWF